MLTSNFNGNFFPHFGKADYFLWQSLERKTNSQPDSPNYFIRLLHQCLWPNKYQKDVKKNN